MSEYIVINIQDMLKAIGEEELQSLLSDFHLHERKRWKILFTVNQ